MSVAGDVSCSDLAANRPKMYEQLARALSDLYETAKGWFYVSMRLLKVSFYVSMRLLKVFF